MEWLFVSLFAVIAVALGVLLVRSARRVQDVEQKYSKIIDLEAELSTRRAAFEAAEDAERSKAEAERRARAAELADVEARMKNAQAAAAGVEAAALERRQRLEAEYEAGLARLNLLKHEVGSLEENLDDLSFGVYKPHFSFDTSEEYKVALERARNQQRVLIRDGSATDCRVEWTIGGDRKEGVRMQKQYLKLMLRAFNAECDAAVANVTWNNALKMEERIRKSLDMVNELGSVMQMRITAPYLQTRLSELRLKREHEEKRYQEREDQRKIREQIREEEKAEREIALAREDAEKEESRYQKALDKARAEAQAATGTQLAKLTEQIASFEAKLDEARKVKERAIARAQLTKSGFVYVISNIGSFGEKVYKIGMTRRLEPMERVQELGDASVPFPFDLHAMLYCDNAPDLEAGLHRLFVDRRVNMVNARKEFYRDVDLSEIEEFVRARGLSAQFIVVPEAKEFRETLAVRAERTGDRKSPDSTVSQFAPQLFPSEVPDSGRSTAP